MSASPAVAIAKEIDGLLQAVATRFNSLPRSELYAARAFREALAAHRLPGSYLPRSAVKARTLTEQFSQPRS